MPSTANVKPQNKLVTSQSVSRITFRAWLQDCQAGQQRKPFKPRMVTPTSCLSISLFNKAGQHHIRGAMLYHTIHSQQALQNGNNTGNAGPGDTAAEDVPSPTACSAANHGQSNASKHQALCRDHHMIDCRSVCILIRTYTTYNQC
jgi:hypothetical protein